MTKKPEGKLDLHQSKKRSAGRQSLEKHFQGELLDIGRGTKIKVRVLDVSPRGIGFLTTESLAVGKRFRLILDTYSCELEIAHCQTHLGIENLFRCGAFSRDQDANLQELISDFLEEVIDSLMPVKIE